MTFYSLGSHPGLAYTALLSTGLSPTTHLAPSLHTSLYGVPQGSIFGPLLFITYTTTLSAVISSLSLYRHLYADDTQLFLAFHPSDFQTSITHLHNALTQITTWMTSNLLSLNSSKTD